jgi:hypothetical protein
MNYYKKFQSVYFLIFIVIGSFFLTILPNILGILSEASDRFAISKMQHIQTEIILHKMKKNENFYNACSTGFLRQEVHQIERNVYCRTNKDSTKIMIYIILRDGFYYAVDSLGVNCTLPELPNVNAVDCKSA